VIESVVKNGSSAFTGKRRARVSRCHGHSSSATPLAFCPCCCLYSDDRFVDERIIGVRAFPLHLLLFADVIVVAIGELRASDSRAAAEATSDRHSR
jgi:hypothetical protein